MADDKAAGNAADKAPLPTSSVLMAISKHVAVKCGGQNRAFIECKKRDGNPQACVKEGDAVTECVVGLLKDVNSRCPEELKAYYQCLDYFSNKFEKCRKEQKAFEAKCPVS